MRNFNREEAAENTAIEGLAAISKTPFKTAFKAKMGIMAAQTLGVLLFVGIGFVIFLTVGFLWSAK